MLLFCPLWETLKVVAAEYPKREQRRITLPYVLNEVHVEVGVGAGLLGPAASLATGQSRGCSCRTP